MGVAAGGAGCVNGVPMQTSLAQIAALAAMVGQRARGRDTISLFTRAWQGDKSIWRAASPCVCSVLSEQRHGRGAVGEATSFSSRTASPLHPQTGSSHLSTRGSSAVRATLRGMLGRQVREKHEEGALRKEFRQERKKACKDYPSGAAAPPMIIHTIPIKHNERLGPSREHKSASGGDAVARRTVRLASKGERAIRWHPRTGTLRERRPPPCGLLAAPLTPPPGCRPPWKRKQSNNRQAAR